MPGGGAGQSGTNAALLALQRQIEQLARRPQPAAGGGGLQSLAAVNAENQTAYAYGYTFLDFTLGTVSDFEPDFPALGMVIDSDELFYPPGAGVYDLQMALRVSTTDLTDEGKLVGLSFKSNEATSGTDSGGWVSGGHQPLRLIAGPPDRIQADLTFTWWDVLAPWNGTLDGKLIAGIDGRYMTVNADATFIGLTVLKRT